MMNESASISMAQIEDSSSSLIDDQQSSIEQGDTGHTAKPIGNLLDSLKVNDHNLLSQSYRSKMANSKAKHNLSGHLDNS